MKSSINLLPNEYAVTEKQQKKFSLVQTLSIFVLLVLFLAGSVIAALRIIQSKDITSAKSNVEKLEIQIGQFKDKEAALFVLKNRLKAISNILSLPSKPLITYAYAEENLPGGISITSVSSDRTGNLIVSLLIPDTSVLETVIDSLTDQAAFEVLSKVELDNLARGKDGVYRLSLKMTPK